MRSKEFNIIMEKLHEIQASIDALRPATPEEVLLSGTQMEEFLKCSASTLKRLRNKGIIPCTQIGRKYYYPKNMLTQEVINSIGKNEIP